MTPVLVTGATGRLGRPTVARLRDAGHDVRALSRRSGPGLVTADLRTGAGLPAALDGVDTVVHLATSPRGSGDIDAARRLLGAAADAGVAHLVLISIVGIEHIPMAYYRDKVVIEALVRDAGVPHTILRATQFHAFVDDLLTAQRRLPVVLAPSVPLQPIAVEDVARRLVELVEAGPSGRVPDVGGPERRDGPGLARQWARARGVRRPVVPVRLPGRVMAAFRAGHALVPGTPYGTRTFADHLAG